MAEYLTPGVFVEDINQVVDMPSGTVPASAFVGVAKSGPVGVPVAVTSWNMYLNTFAGGQESAFLTNSYLAYAVYGFFQNGGKLCYVLRVSSGTVASDNTITYAAKSATSTGEDAFAKAFPLSMRVIGVISLRLSVLSQVLMKHLEFSLYRCYSMMLLLSLGLISVVK